MYLLDLSQVTAKDAPRVGGKALRLAELAQAGFLVPPGLVLTAEAYRLALQEAKLSRHLTTLATALEPTSPRFEETVDDLQRAIRRHPLPSPVMEALEEAYQALSSHKALVVRSSATAEDLATASFAGQYETHLNVRSLEELADAVRACWASLWNGHAVAYRRERGIAPTDLAMAVLLQPQVPAQASGVLFTLNPLNGRENEMVVEAAWGLGEGLVSGRVTPDRYVVDWQRRRILRREIVDKKVMVVPVDGGTAALPVPEDRRLAPTLDDEQVLTLVELGYRIQAHYGAPQDVEWAWHDGQFHILQSRPLTAITFAPEEGIWTSANFEEVMPGFVSPLSFSISVAYEYVRSLNEFLAQMGIAPPGMAVTEGRLFFGRVYWRVDRLKELLQLLPGFKEREFDHTVGIEPAYEGDGLVVPFTPRTILRGLPILLRLNRAFRTWWREADAYCRRFREEIEPAWDAVDPSALDDEALAERVRQVIALHWEANRVALITTYLSVQAQDDFRPMLEALNASLPPDEEPISEGRLLTGLSDVRTGRPIERLWELAQAGRREPAVVQTFAEAPPDRVLDRLAALPEAQPFYQALQAFLDEFRYMAANDEDLSLPRWDEDPTYPLTLLRQFLLGDEAHARHPRWARQTAIREEEEARAARLLSRGVLGRLLPFRRRQFFGQLALVQRYIWWREETREIASRAFYQTRRFLVELGRRWTHRGLIERPEEVFLLTREQVLDGLAGRLSPQAARESIEAYRRLRTCYRNFQPPGVMGADVRVQVHEARPGQARYTGVPCSPGVAVGPARIVTDLSQAHKVQPGDILVAPYTNPGWLPLFSLVAGLVIEEGGLLSHGAVVAREYGIPAVLHVPGATRLFRDGQRLRVDGSRGTVEIEG